MIDINSAILYKNNDPVEFLSFERVMQGKIVGIVQDFSPMYVIYVVESSELIEHGYDWNTAAMHSAYIRRPDEKFFPYERKLH